MRLFQLALLCLFASLQYQLWFGHHGVKDYKKLQSAVTQHTKVNARLEKRNKLPSRKFLIIQKLIFHIWSL